MNSAITLTFGDQAENHVGMQKIGSLADYGFTYDDLILAKNNFEALGSVCQLIDLDKKVNGEMAYVLIIRNAVDKILSEGANALFNEQNKLNPDKQAYMYGRVVNKKARYNLCFDVNKQNPDYVNKKGTVVSYAEVPLLRKIRDKLPDFLGDKAKDLTVEGNYYYDVNNTGIGFHGDSERKKVIAIRLGKSIPLHYQWFLKGEPVGDRIKLKLNHGDIYVMSEKATGYDWKLKNIPTLRHAAGAKKYLEIKNKKKIKYKIKN